MHSHRPAPRSLHGTFLTQNSVFAPREPRPHTREIIAGSPPETQTPRPSSRDKRGAKGSNWPLIDINYRQPRRGKLPLGQPTATGT